MKKVIILCFVATLFFNTTSSFAEINDSDVGRYQLFSIKENGKEVLCRIDTKTGKVWQYAPQAVLSENDINDSEPERKEAMKKMLSAARAKGKSVATLPYWVPLSETQPDMYTTE